MWSQTVVSEATGVLQQGETSTTSRATGTTEGGPAAKSQPWLMGETVLRRSLPKRTWGHLRRSWSHTTLTCCQKTRESREARWEIPWLLPNPCPSLASASQWLHLRSSQRVTGSGKRGSLQCAAERETSPERIQEPTGGRTTQTFTEKDRE